MSQDTFDRAYTILVELAGASERHRESFLHEFSQPEPTHEWRFGGKLPGGKFRRNTTRKRFFVTCNWEVQTAEHTRVIAAVNDELARLPFA